MKKTHGLSQSGSSTYSSWKHMRRRCNTKNDLNYKDYGGRGIKVCRRWDSFEKFLSDMGEKPKGHVLDRIKNWRGYSPKNCRWASPKESSRNRSHLKKYTINGVRKWRYEWEEEFGNSHLIRQRLYSGWTFKEAICAGR